MMNIVKENKIFKLVWEYAIKNNKTTKKGKEYYFYNCVFPAELADYFSQNELFIYREMGHNYITNEEPPFEFSKKIKLFNKGNPQRAKDITLSKKFFKELDGYVKGKVVYVLHVDEKDIFNQRGKLEILLNIQN